MSRVAIEHSPRKDEDLGESTHVVEIGLESENKTLF